MMKKKHWISKVVGIVALVIVAAAALSYIVMCLWNGVLVPVLGVSVVSFWQAAGILLLSKILFGGFKGKGGRGGHWKKEMREKWEQMTPQERENMQQQWKERCGRWGRRGSNANPVSEGE